jgi:hypothetical protein
MSFLSAQSLIIPKTNLWKQKKRLDQLKKLQEALGQKLKAKDNKILKKNHYQLNQIIKQNQCLYFLKTIHF